MSEHTRGLWHTGYHARLDGHGGDSHFSVKCGDKEIVRTVNQVATAADEANIRLIVRAVNAHDDLLEACQIVLASLRLDNGNQADIHVLEAAIAKAKGGEHDSV